MLIRKPCCLRTSSYCLLLSSLGQHFIDVAERNHNMMELVRDCGFGAWEFWNVDIESLFMLKRNGLVKPPVLVT